MAVHFCVFGGANFCLMFWCWILKFHCGVRIQNQMLKLKLAICSEFKRSGTFWGNFWSEHLYFYSATNKNKIFLVLNQICTRAQSCNRNHLAHYLTQNNRCDIFLFIFLSTRNHSTAQKLHVHTGTKLQRVLFSAFEMAN